MVVTIEQMERGISNYMDCEIGRKASGVQKFGVYFMMPMVQSKVRSIVDTMRSDTSMFDDSGNIDVDIVRERARSAMSRCGAIEIAGIRFNESDVDSIARYIQEA